MKNGKVSYPYQKVTDFFVQAMQDDDIPPWEKPWISNGTSTHRWNGKEYRGLNWLMTLSTGREGPWLTRKMINAAGGRIKKGEKSIPVVFWKISGYKVKDEKGAETDEVRKSFTMFYYRVWSLEQTTVPKSKYPKWLKEARAKNKPKKNGKALAKSVKESTMAFVDYIKREGIEVKEGSDRAFYRPADDSITIPSESQYKSSVEYVRTRSHETVHSTGTPGRCARFDYDARINPFGSEDYSKEELVAEIGAAMLDAQFGLRRPKVDRNSAAYIKSWAKRLKDDPKLIVSAAQRAQKAVDYILDRKFDEQEPTNGSD